MSHPGYQKFQDLDYTPSHGTVDVRGEIKTFGLPVTISQGRDMEADGIPVCWVYASIPAWAAIPVIGSVAMWVSRAFTWPSRIGK